MDTQGNWFKYVVMALALAVAASAPGMAFAGHQVMTGQVDCKNKAKMTVYRYNVRIEWDYDGKTIKNVKHQQWLTNRNTALVKSEQQVSAGPSYFYTWRSGYSKSGYHSEKRMAVGVKLEACAIWCVGGSSTWYPQSIMTLHADGSGYGTLECS